MKIAITLAVLLCMILFYLGRVESERLAYTSRARLGGQIERGAALYAMHCRTCHGVKGEGVGQLGPGLADSAFFTRRKNEVGWTGTLEQYVISTTEHGRMMGTRPMYAGNGSTAVMPPWLDSYGGPLRSDEIETLALFIVNWQQTATGKILLQELVLPSVSPDDPQLVDRGKMVFAKECASCHAYKNIQVGPARGPDLTKMGVNKELQGDAADYIRESVLIPGAVIVQGFAAIAEESPCGAVLTEPELTAVTSFLLQ